MPNKKVDSGSLKKLNDRINGLKAIHPQLVFKSGLSLATAEQLKNDLLLAQNEFNTALALLNRKRADLAELEKKADECSKNIYFAVRSEYGDDSLEYEQVGGVRISQRAKRIQKSKTI
jgi:hypothetical protein